jgi:hypothetical protein
MAKPHKAGAYDAIIRHVFEQCWRPGASTVAFSRDHLRAAARALDHEISNIGDILYSYRYRRAMPLDIAERAPADHLWVIRGTGDAGYAFVAVPADQEVVPNPLLAVTAVPDATPGIIERYAQSDEQALLARVRYNRLLDVFTGITCYPLQSHLRTKVPGIGQVETDELYVGLDRHGAHYVLPVQAKGGRDRMSIVQIEQDVALCCQRFPELRCRAIGAQFMADEVIALFSFEDTADGVRMSAERHYRLVPSEQIGPEDLARYRAAAEQASGAA